MIPIKEYARFLVENGLIFEINRKVLHPFGLSLVVDVNRNNSKYLTMTLVETEDADGFLYDEESFAVGTENYQKFLDKTGGEKLEARKKEHGFIIQEK